MDKALYIQDGGVSLYDLKCWKVKPSADCIPWSDNEKIEQLLTSISLNERLFLVLDVVDEDISFEWKPKLFPWEKGQFLKLEEARTQREGALLQRIHWTGVSRKTENDIKEELLSKSIVHQNDHIDFIFQQIESLGLRLNGIYSISYLIDQWFHKVAKFRLKKLKGRLKSPFFLLMRLSQYRFRQLFYFNGLLRISRDFKVDEHLENESAIHAAVMVESQAAQKYLYNQKIVPYNTPVSMVVIDDKEKTSTSWQNFFQEHYVNSNWSDKDWFFQVLSLPNLVKKRQVQPWLNGQLLLAMFAIEQRPVTYYQHEYLKKITTYHVTSKTLHVSIFLTTVFLLFYGVYQAVSLYFLNEKIKLYQHQIVQYSEEKQRLQKVVKLDYDAKDLKASVDFSQALLALKKGRDAGIDWLPLTNLLDQSPHILIDQLTWKVADKLDAPEYVVELKGLVFPFEGNFEAPTTWVDQFVSALKKLPNVTSVTLNQEPLERDLKHALTVSSEALSAQALPFRLQFKVKR